LESEADDASSVSVQTNSHSKKAGPEVKRDTLRDRQIIAEEHEQTMKQRALGSVLNDRRSGVRCKTSRYSIVPVRFSIYKHYTIGSPLHSQCSSAATRCSEREPLTSKKYRLHMLFDRVKLLIVNALGRHARSFLVNEDTTTPCFGSGIL
jgi:hypothetical protein